MGKTNRSKRDGQFHQHCMHFLVSFFFHVLPSSLAVCVHLLPLLLCFNCKRRGIGSVILTCAGPELLALML